MDAWQRGAWSFIHREASPLATPPAAHVAPVAAPASLCLSVCTHYIHTHISELSSNDTDSPILCHVIAPCLSSPSSLSGRIIASFIHVNSHSVTASFFCPSHCQQTFADTQQMLLNIPHSSCSLCLKFVLDYSFLIFSVVPFFSRLPWLSFLGSVVMRTSLPLSLSLFLSHSFLFGSNQNNCLGAQFTYAPPVICNSSVRICWRLLKTNKIFNPWCHQEILPKAAAFSVKYTENDNSDIRCFIML